MTTKGTRLRPVFAVLLAVAVAAAALLAHHADRAASAHVLHWPLPFDNGCTSSFGEYRATHFHGGVDFRTRRTIGWPCYAVGDGRIVRIRREPHGYGRVLYLRLDDGRTAVYGHVCRFENDGLHLDDALAKACEKAGTSFPGNVFLNPAPRVKKGEIVAFSGDLGVGAPHLHLEIRRGEKLCDPFAEGLPLPKGAGPPVVKGIYFVPLTSEASVDGGFQPRFFGAVQKKGRLGLRRIPTLSGSIEAEAVVSDDLGVNANTTGISLLRANFDGREIFGMDLKCIGLSRYKESPLLFDDGNRRRGSSTIRLRRLPGFGVPGVSGSGLPAPLPSGKHELTVEAGDHTGMTATLSTPVLCRKRKAKWKLSLPGSGYSLKKAEVSARGLIITAKRKSTRGRTPVVFGKTPVLAMRISIPDSGRVKVLIPFNEIPHSSSELKLAGKPAGWIVASGPGTLSSGGFTLSLPKGTAAMMLSQRKRKNGARLVAGPRLLQGAIIMTLLSTEPGRGRGVYLGKRFLDNWTGKAIRYGGNGVYNTRIDSSPPGWGRAAIVTIPNLGVKELRIKLSDKGSGPYLKTLKLSMDGKPCFADYDMDSGQVRISLTGVSPGVHSVTGTCSDFAGNRGTLARRTFTLGG